MELFVTPPKLSLYFEDDSLPYVKEQFEAFPSSGENNFTVENADAAIKTVLQKKMSILIQGAQKRNNTTKDLEHRAS